MSKDQWDDRGPIRFSPRSGHGCADLTDRPRPPLAARVDLDALAAWSERNAVARAEYHAHPFTDRRRPAGY